MSSQPKTASYLTARNVVGDFSLESVYHLDVSEASRQMNGRHAVL